MFFTRAVSLFVLGLSAFTGVSQASPISGERSVDILPGVTIPTLDDALIVLTEFDLKVKLILPQIATIDKLGGNVAPLFETLYREYDIVTDKLLALPADVSEITLPIHTTLTTLISGTQIAVDQTVARLRQTEANALAAIKVRDLKDKFLNAIKIKITIIWGTVTIKIEIGK